MLALIKLHLKKQIVRFVRALTVFLLLSFGTMAIMCHLWVDVLAHVKPFLIYGESPEKDNALEEYNYYSPTTTERKGVA
jgi:hypothetical protein